MQVWLAAALLAATAPLSLHHRSSAVRLSLRPIAADDDSTGAYIDDPVDSGDDSAVAPPASSDANPPLADDTSDTTPASAPAAQYDVGALFSLARSYAPRAPRSTPTTAVSSPTPAVPAATGPGSQAGDASWFDGDPHTCAHRTLPQGTTVTVTDRTNGKHTTCRVIGVGPTDPTRIIDLSKDTFAALADPGLGVIPVNISW
jgi:rare lipoprotein A